MSDKDVSIALSVALLVVDLGLLWLLNREAKKPIDPLKPRLISKSFNTFLFLLLVMVGFAILAHIISLLSGVQVKPKRKMGL